MSTSEKYVIPVELRTWDIAATGAARFNWDYDDGRDQLLSLYQKGKDKQWDAIHRIDWELDVDPDDPLGMPPLANPIATSRTWERIQDDPKAVGELRQHQAAWQFSQFLHGEQGAMICSARIVESVPDLDAKFYAATQTMDEARHAETYARFLQEKIGLVYPINPDLKALLGRHPVRLPLGHALPRHAGADRRAGAGRLRRAAGHDDHAAAQADPGVRDAGRGPACRVRTDRAAGLLPRADRRRSGDEREEFVVEGCYLMRDRFRGQEIWDLLGYDRADCEEAVRTSPFMQAYQALLFSRIVPCVQGHRPVGPEGPAGVRGHGRAGHGRGQPGRADGRRTRAWPSRWTRRSGSWPAAGPRWTR